MNSTNRGLNRLLIVALGLLLLLDALHDPEER